MIKWHCKSAWITYPLTKNDNISLFKAMTRKHEISKWCLKQFQKQRRVQVEVFDSTVHNKNHSSLYQPNRSKDKTVWPNNNIDNSGATFSNQTPSFTPGFPTFNTQHSSLVPRPTLQVSTPEPVMTISPNAIHKRGTCLDHLALFMDTYLIFDRLRVRLTYPLAYTCSSEEIGICPKQCI